MSSQRSATRRKKAKNGIGDPPTRQCYVLGLNLGNRSSIRWSSASFQSIEKVDNICRLKARLNLTLWKSFFAWRISNKRFKLLSVSLSVSLLILKRHEHLYDKILYSRWPFKIVFIWLCRSYLSRQNILIAFKPTIVLRYLSSLLHKYIREKRSHVCQFIFGA